MSQRLPKQFRVPMKYPLISRNGVFAVLLLALGINFGAGRLPGASIDPSRLPASGWAGQVGIPGGIPTNYTQFCNVTQSIPGYSGALADPTGVADSSPAINFAIQHCPNNQYVYIPTGNYHIGSQLSRQGINNFETSSILSASR